MKVACIGAGYVGTVTAASCAASGHDTTVIDIDRRKVDRLLAGQSPIFEPGLEDLIRRHIGSELHASSSYDSIREAEVVFICVGTPSMPDGTADLSYVKAAAMHIGKQLSGSRFAVIVNKSTVPAGTTDLVSGIIEQASGYGAERDFAVVSNPEFLREGFAVEDVFAPDRIVIGTKNGRARAVMRKLYRKLLEAPKPPAYIETDPKSAELIKYASNSFLALKISYINEIARLCEVLGANALEVAKGIGLDSRIGDKFLQVSSGWSGSCFPKDTAELLATGRKYGQELSLVQAAIESNARMHRYCVEKVRRRLKTLNGKRIGILGLTFKPNTDDARSTQASAIIRELAELGAEIAAHDPLGMTMFQSLNPQLPVHYCRSAEDVADRADALILLTHWEQYRDLDWGLMQTQMKSPYILDTRNFLAPDRMNALGYTYEGLGVT